MAAMAAMAAVMSSTGIRDYGNRTTRRQDTFGTSTESSLAGVCVTGVYSLSNVIIVSDDTLALRSTAVDTISVSKDTRSKYLYR